MTTSGPPTLGAALGYWLKLGCLGFGGPAAQIAMMHRDLVLRLGWIDERQFLRALNYCLLLPGPEAQQLATYLGWRLHGVRGGMLSGGLFILPALIIITLIGWAYASHRNTGLVRTLLLALNPAVIALLLLSLHSLARRVLTSRTAVLLALLGSLLMLCTPLPLPVVMLMSGLIGIMAGMGSHAAEVLAAPKTPVWMARESSRGGQRKLLLALLLAWLLPAAVILLASPYGSVWWVLLGTASELALLSFGGAYVVLPLLYQRAVDDYAWLAPNDMLSALALGESTPGPLIMVVTFVGFLAGWSDATASSPWLGGLLGALITTHYLFLPSFAFVLLAAPIIEGWQPPRSLSGLMAGIGAAAISAMLSLTVRLLQRACLDAGGAVDPQAAGWCVLALGLAAGLARYRGWALAGLTALVMWTNGYLDATA